MNIEITKTWINIKSNIVITSLNFQLITVLPESLNRPSYKHEHITIKYITN